MSGPSLFFSESTTHIASPDLKFWRHFHVVILFVVDLSTKRYTVPADHLAKLRRVETWTSKRDPSK